MKILNTKRFIVLMLSAGLLAACRTSVPQAPEQPNQAAPTEVAPAPTVAPAQAPANTPLPQATATARRVNPPTPQIVATVGETTNTAAAPTATGAAARATSRPAPTSAPVATAAPTRSASNVAPAANAIPVKQASAKFSSITSSQSAMYLTLDGKGGDGKAIKGNMTVGLSADVTGKKSHIEIGGNLIGPLLSAQLRGFNPRGMGIYDVSGSTFVRLDTLLTVCAKPKGGIPGLDNLASSLTTDGFLDMIGSDRVFPGKLVGDATLNGLAVQHYTLDLAALKQSAQRRGLVNWPELSRGEMWLAKDGGYIVRLSVAGKGKAGR
ncbi:MAG: hypothetical protein HC853_18280, partial [Anaerolineae bacterium]|nr:hypothetical protein [Anaerolineae bacterium]